MEIFGAMVLASGIEPLPGQNDTLNKLIEAARDEVDSLGTIPGELGDVQYLIWRDLGSPTFELKELI